MEQVDSITMDEVRAALLDALAGTAAAPDGAASGPPCAICGCPSLRVGVLDVTRRSPEGPPRGAP